MRIALFDAINERHVGESLERALLARGHDVHATGPVWHGSRFPGPDEQRERIGPAVRAMLEWEPEAMLCLRAFALRPRLVERIRAAGVTTLVWFADDPVLYKVGYRHVVESYDVVLHCGPAAVLDFYERRHGATGVNFPFWTDTTAFPYAHEPAAADVDAIFLGSTVGQVRARRYGLLASLPAEVRVQGQVETDPAGIARPFLRDHGEVVAALARARVGISLAQRFADYRGHEYDYPGLAALGSFELPSRVIQYAATGLPVVSLDPAGASDALPEMVVAHDRDDLAARLEQLLADPDGLRELGLRTRARFERRLSAERRAEVLEALLRDPDGWRALSIAERATLWRGDDPEPEDPAPGRRRLPVAAPAAPAIVVAGYYGAANAGDELILQAIAARLSRTAEDLTVVVAAQRPAEVVRAHGLAAFARSDLPLAEAVVRSSSALVLGGGGLLQDIAFTRAGGLAGMFSEPALSIPGWAPLVVLAEILGRPVHMFGLGVGPLGDADARRLVAWLVDRADSISVRDPHSRGLLESLPGVTAPVELAPDPVYALELGEAGPPRALERLAGGKPLLAVNLRPWQPAEPADLHRRVAAAITPVARRHGLAVVGVPMQAGLDEDALEATLGELPQDIERLTLPWTADAEMLAAVLRASAATLAMRLHACLLSHRVGTPAVGLAYDAKVTSHFDEVERPASCLPLDAGPEEIERSLEAALSQPAEARHPCVAVLEAAARTGLDRLSGRIESSTLTPVRLPEAVLAP